jgi:hypothetical protein
MRINYTRALVWVRRAALAFAGFVVTTIVGGFILQLCEGADWYKHPWDTVARLIDFVHWFLGNSIVHWIGGAAVGFALGIWIDDLLRRLAAKAPPSPVTVVKLEKGFLDYQNDLFEAGKEMSANLANATKQTEWIGKEIEKQTAKLNKLNAKANDAVPERKVKRALNLAGDIAHRFDLFSGKITESNKTFGTIANKMTESIQWLHDNQPLAWQDKPSREAIAALRDSCKIAKDQMNGFVAGMRGSRGVSATLNGSIDQAASVMEKYIATISNLEDFCIHLLQSPSQVSVTPEI